MNHPSTLRIEVVAGVGAAADLAAIAAIEAASFRRPWSHRSLERELINPQARVLVARDGGSGTLVGYLIRWNVGDELQILNLAVAPAARRRGVARRLLGAVVAEASASGRRVILEVECGNTAAESLYANLGFEPVGRRPNLYGQGRHGRTLAWTPTPNVEPNLDFVTEAKI